MKYKSSLFLLFVLFAQACSTPQPTVNNTAVTPVAATVEAPKDEIDSLLSVMTIEEKVGQMTQVTIDLILKDNSTTEVDPEKLRTALLTKKVGSILNVKGHAYTAEQWFQILEAIQTVATKEARVSIPVLYGIDAIHGANYIEGATLFPHNIGMSATRNPALIHRAAEITAAETRAVGIPWNFDPVLDIGRQPLWPRFEETFGEDVYLVKTMGAAAIRGYEEDGLEKGTAVASCMKHFLGYSLPATGKDRTPTYIPDYILREYVLPPFQAAVDAGVSTVMINSGEVNGVPVHGSKYYMTQILREELGFKGVAVSDWEDVIRLHTRHRVAATPKEAVRLAVDAGLDMSMVPVDYSFYDLLVELVKEGAISEERINLSVRRILELKKKLGLFEKAFPDRALLSNVNTAVSDSVAYQAALESITLLKNEKNILPLSKNKKVLVAGPTANAYGPLHGSWSYVWQGSDESLYPERAKTVLQSIIAEIGKDKVVSRAVNDFTAAANYDAAQLKKDARNVDAIILCLGEKAYAESPGVIDDLELDANQLALAKAAMETGKPVVLLMLQGRPRVISSIEPGMQAVLLGYRPSTWGGPAIADILFGDYNPNGVLSFTYPRYSGDVVLYDYKGTEEIREDKPNTYGKGGFNPQWTFGHGLSYTTFALSDLKTDKQNFRGKNDKINVSVRVKNTGNRAGMKAVELYSRDLFASITPSDRRLRAFQKVSLAPGEEKVVNFTLTPEELAFVNQQGVWVTEPGDFDLMVGDLKARINYQE